MSTHDNIFQQIIEMAVPKGGYVMILAEAYMDESGTHAASDKAVVAGYLFKREQAERFSRDWQKVLDHYGLPYAHMKEASNCVGIYKKAGMSKEDCIASNRLLIENTKRRSVFAFGVSVVPQMYNDIVGVQNNAPSIYSFCLKGCMTILRRWVERHSFEGFIAYVFEAGNEWQGEADRFIRDALLFSDSAKMKHRYASHNFIDKAVAKPLQSADFLAWQYHHYHARKVSKGIEEPRADFSALIRPQDMVIDHDEASLKRFRDQIVEPGWFIGRY